MSVRIGKVKYKGNLTALPAKKCDSTNLEFRNAARHVADCMPEIDTFVVMAIGPNREYMVKYIAGSRDVELLPIYTAEQIRYVVNRNMFNDMLKE